MRAGVRDIVEPSTHLLVRGLDVEGQARDTQLRHQRHIKAVAQKADEALHLALGFGSTRLAHLRQIPIAMGEIQECRLEAKSF